MSSTSPTQAPPWPPIDAASEGLLPPGATTGQYRIDEVIAQGGCGAVYAATHPETRRRAAVKVLHPSLAALPSMVERFRREVQVVNLLRHPNIVEIYDVGVLADNRPFYVMEHLAGATLDGVLQRTGRLSIQEALEILEPVCSALGAAHEAGVIHRDIKASNICIVNQRERRVVKLLDFGIAKLVGPHFSSSGLTSVGRRLGTLSAMAPEQILGETIDARADIYALGVLLHKMLTGRTPFRAGSDEELARQHLEEPPPRPSRLAPTSRALDAIVLRCLEKSPDHRFASAADFLGALRTAVGEGLAERKSRHEETASAVGVCLAVHFDTDDEEGEIDLIDDLECVLDLVEERLRDAKFLLPMTTGSTLLGVRLLAEDPGLRRLERQDALDLALAIYEAIAARPAADARLSMSLCVHVGEVLLNAAPRREIRGGALVRTSSWACTDPSGGLFATDEMLEGLTGFEVGRTRGGLFDITPQACSRKRSARSTRPEGRTAEHVRPND